MFSLTCLRLAPACDSADSRGCSFLNIMSATRRSKAGDALHGSAHHYDSVGFFLMRKICISGAFFMCQDAWTNQQHITLPKNEMLTNVDISNLIDT